MIQKMIVPIMNIESFRKLIFSIFLKSFLLCRIQIANANIDGTQIPTKIPSN